MSGFFLKLSAYLAKLQARAWLSHALCAPAKTQLKDEESARNNHVFGCNFAIYSPILIFSTLRLSNKPFLIWYQQPTTFKICSYTTL